MTFPADLLETLLYAGIAAIYVGVATLGFIWVKDLLNKRLW